MSTLDRFFDEKMTRRLPVPRCGSLNVSKSSAKKIVARRNKSMDRVHTTRFIFISKRWVEHIILTGNASPEGTKLKIRIAQISDLATIVDIYNQSIPSKQSTGDTQLLHVEDRITWFAEHRSEKHPIFVAEVDERVAGWCSLSAYRPGRAAFRYTAEISYYIALSYHRRGIGTALLEHALAACPALRIRHLFAIVLENNEASINLLEKMGFEQWGYLPRVADFDDKEVGHLYYGLHVG
jgi:phosphinothricin acetyltransferase